MENFVTACLHTFLRALLSRTFNLFSSFIEYETFHNYTKHQAELVLTFTALAKQRFRNRMSSLKLISQLHLGLPVVSSLRVL